MVVYSPVGPMVQLIVVIWPEIFHDGDGKGQTESRGRNGYAMGLPPERIDLDPLKE